MPDPMLTFLDADSPAAFVGKANENTRRRHCWDLASFLDKACTVLSTHEWLKVSATTAVRAMTLLSAVTGNALLVEIVAADGTNTYTLTPAGGQTIDGAGSKVVTSAKKYLLMPDGVSNWTVWDLS